MANRFGVSTPFTWDAATTTHWSASSGGAGGASVPGISDTGVFDAASGAGVVTRTATGALGTLDFRGLGITGDFAGTFAGSGQIGGLNGNLTWSPAMTASYTGTIFFNASSVIKSNGLTTNNQYTVNVAGGTVQQNDDLHTTKGLALTFAGSWKTNGHAARFDNGINLSSASVRTFDFSGSTVTLGGNTGGGVFTSATNLTLTFDGTSKLQFLQIGNAASFQMAGLTWPDAELAGSGAGTLTVTGGGTLRNITLTNTGGASLNVNGTMSATSLKGLAGCTATFAGTQDLALTGDYQLVGTMPNPTFSGVLTFNGTGAQSVTTGGLTLAHNCTVNGVGNTVTLQDAYTSTNTWSISGGTLKTNGKAVRTRGMVTTAGTIGLDMRGSTWTIDTTNAPSNWAGAAASAWTFTTDANSKLVFSLNGNNTTFIGGAGNTYPYVAVQAPGAGICAFSGVPRITVLDRRTVRPPKISIRSLNARARWLPLTP